MTTLKPPPLPTQPDDLAIRSSRLAGVALLIFLFVGLLSSGRLIVSGQISLLPGKVLTSQILDGDITHRIAKELSNAYLPTTFAELERGVSWLLLNDTGPRVRSGCPGWLFLADELKVNHQAQRNADAKAQAVIDLKQQLSQRGISLLVVIVPDKSRIASEQRCTLHRPAALEGRIQAWTSKLDAGGVSNLDLTAALTPLGASAWLRTDTHWSESGAKTAADAITQRLKTLGISATPSRSFNERHAPLAVRPGDLSIWRASTGCRSNGNPHPTWSLKPAPTNFPLRQPPTLTLRQTFLAMPTSPTPRSSALHSHATPTSQGFCSRHWAPPWVTSPKTVERSLALQTATSTTRLPKKRRQSKSSGKSRSGTCNRRTSTPLPIALCGRQSHLAEGNLRQLAPCVQGHFSRLLPSSQQCFSFPANDNLSQG